MRIFYFTPSNDKNHNASLTLNMAHSDLELAWLLVLKSKQKTRLI